MGELNISTHYLDILSDVCVLILCKLAYFPLKKNCPQSPQSPISFHKVCIHFQCGDRLQALRSLSCNEDSLLSAEFTDLSIQYWPSGTEVLPDTESSYTARHPTPNFSITIVQFRAKLKALDTLIGICQRPVISLGLSKHV